MAEWLKAHAWKACLGETLTWVRIPLSPPLENKDLHGKYRRSGQYWVIMVFRDAGLNLYRRHRRACKAKHSYNQRTSEFKKTQKGWKRCECPTVASNSERRARPGIDQCLAMRRSNDSYEGMGVQRQLEQPPYTSFRTGTDFEPRSRSCARRQNQPNKIPCGPQR
jgi:hypothetical protein